MQSNILLSGSTGLVGTALQASLQDGRHAIRQLVRHPVHPDTRNVSWDPASGKLESEKLEGLTAAVHLAGEPIAARRWNPEQKKRIRDSRVEGTRLLAESLARAKEKPDVLVCASAIGYYGARGDEELTEQSKPGEGFLAEVTRDWEEAANPAREAGIRVVHLRLGVVLSPKGGALAKMLTPFRLGLGGPLGDGTPWMSWVTLTDVVSVFRLALDRKDMEGAYNVTAPHPVRNRDFAKALGQAVHRPAVLPLPAFAIRTLLGEMGETLLLHSARVLPNKLTETENFTFQHPELLPALEAMLPR